MRSAAAVLIIAILLASFSKQIDDVVLDVLFGKLPAEPSVFDAERWGDQIEEQQNAPPTKYTVRIDDKVIQDLRTRLAQRRGFPAMPHANWSYGTDAKYLDGLLDHWSSGYDWRKDEDDLNRIGLYSLVVDGLSIVFHHVVSGAADASAHHFEPRGGRLGLLLLHGWPGSILEFRELLRLLSTPGSPRHLANIDLVVPCLPGYGFSSAPTREGYGVFPMARTLSRLMARLGYSRYIVQGGDWGSIVAQAMALTHPTPILGVHLNFFPVLPGGPMSLLVDWLMIRFKDSDASRTRAYNMNDIGLVFSLTGYFHQQSTKPETLGAALSVRQQDASPHPAHTPCPRCSKPW